MQPRQSKLKSRGGAENKIGHSTFITLPALQHSIEHLTIPSQVCSVYWLVLPFREREFFYTVK